MRRVTLRSFQPGEGAPKFIGGEKVRCWTAGLKVAAGLALLINYIDPS